MSDRDETVRGGVREGGVPDEAGRDEPEAPLTEAPVTEAPLTEAPLTEAPFTEAELEALAHGRRDLVRESVARAYEEDDALRAWIEREREGSHEASVALKRAAPELDDLDAMISMAMAKAPEASDVAAPSRASLWTGAMLGAAIATLSGVASVVASSEPTAVAREAWTEMTTLARLGVTLAMALDRIADFVPGGWMGIAVIGLVVFAVLALPLRAMAGPWLRPSSTGAAVLALSLLGASQTAHAYDLEGTWPEPDARVTVDADRTPLSEALRQALASSNLGLAYSLPDDPQVTLHVRDAPLREVLDALLADVAARVRHTGHLVVIREPSATPDAQSNGTAAPAEATPPVPPTPPVPAVPSEPVAPMIPAPPLAPPTLPPPPLPPGPVATGSSAELRDLVTFGGNAHVMPGQQVRDVITMGGDATVEGEAFGSVATMGGDAEVRGTVVGDVVTMGGDIRVTRGGRVHGQLNAMGGDVSFDEPDAASTRTAITPALARAPSSHGHHDDDGRSWIGDALEAAMRHALLFLLGLLFMGVAPARLTMLQSTIVAQPLRVLASGFLGVIAGAVLTVVLVITILGIPAAIVLALGLFLGAYLGLATTASVLGAALPIAPLKGRPVLQLAAGVVVLFVVSRVPIIGALLVSGATLAGLGAVLLTRLGQRSIEQR